MLKEFSGFNLAVHNCLITANLRWGNVVDACKLFDEMPERNEVSWTSLVSGLLKHGKVNEAIIILRGIRFQMFFLGLQRLVGLFIIG